MDRYIPQKLKGQEGRENDVHVAEELNDCDQIGLVAKDNHTLSQYELGCGTTWTQRETMSVASTTSKVSLALQQY
eukprot:137324-Hanusia_phi.AAC.2